MCRGNEVYPSPIPISRRSTSGPTGSRTGPLCCRRGPLCYRHGPRICRRRPIGELSRGPIGLPIRVRDVLRSVRFQRSGHSTSFVTKISRTRSDRHFVGQKHLLRALFSTVRARGSVSGTVDRLIFRNIVKQDRARRRVHGLARHTFSLPRIGS